METAAAILYVVLARVVTVDVLLKKSDVRSALGWIGTVWLAPIFGSILYYLFGINRVTRRTLKMSRLDNAQASPPSNIEPDCSANIALLSDVIEKLTHGPVTAGNGVGGGGGGGG